MHWSHSFIRSIGFGGDLPSLLWWFAWKSFPLGPRLLAYLTQEWYIQVLILFTLSAIGMVKIKCEALSSEFPESCGYVS